jgi:diguanylate cyclase (GGDEF)-like protein/PAS domain S-box-containing protein
MPYSAITAGKGFKKTVMKGNIDMIEPDEIMIVDDNPTVLEFLADILIDNGYKVRPVGSGESALRSVASDPPQLILLDILMPGMDGFEVCRQLKARKESHNIPVLFISSASALHKTVEGLALGAVDFISKPFQREELLARVRTHLELNRLRTDLEAQVEGRTNELRKSEAKLRSLFAAMTDIIIVVDVKGRYLEIAPTRTNPLYKTFQESQGETLHEVFPAAQADLLLGAIHKALEMSQAITVDYSLHLDHEEFWFLATISPLGADAAIIVACDITGRKRAEQALRESEERYRAIIENIEDGYYEVDLEGNMTFCNPSHARMLGYSQNELIGMNHRSYMDEQHADEIFSIFNRISQTGSPTKAFDWELIRKDGLKLPVEASVSLVRDAEGQPVGMRGIIRDNTERKRMEEEMREMSFRDQLTGLYNRRGFITLAEQQMKTTNRAKRQMPLAFIDVDNMKSINDTLGHEEGDKALINTANILRQTFRESDIIARIGGDEFAVLAIDVTEMNPEILSSRLQQNIDSHTAKEDHPYKLSMSWGTAVYDPEVPVSLDELMSEADKLMYAEKKAKSNRGRL